MRNLRIDTREIRKELYSILERAAFVISRWINLFHLPFSVERIVYISKFSSRFNHPKDNYSFLKIFQNYTGNKILPPKDTQRISKKFTFTLFLSIEKRISSSSSRTKFSIELESPIHRHNDPEQGEKREASGGGGKKKKKKPKRKRERERGSWTSTANCSTYNRLITLRWITREVCFSRTNWLKGNGVRRASF